MLDPKYRATFVFAFLLILAESTGQGAEQQKFEGRLRDISGSVHAPFEDQATRAVVLVFISTDCPIANAYQPQLGRLAKKHASQGVQWFMVHPDPATTSEQAAEHARQFEISVPVVVDVDQSIARGVGARVTPEVFVFQRGQEEAAYQGRIDDLHADYGRKRVAATTHELADCLQSIADGQPVRVRKTDAVGCLIAFHEPDQKQDSRAESAYDPLSAEEATVEQQTFTVKDADRSREIPLRIYLPESVAPAPVILFSHGLGGSRDNGPYLGKHWAARGYVVVFMQHPGSDESVWKDARLGDRMNAMNKAASGQNFLLRVKDVPAVIDQLEKWNQEAGHSLKGRIDPDRLGMAGHSFGAMTTQAVSGQTFLGREAFTDPRIKAALPMSPSSPKKIKPERSFGNVTIPWLLMTGTNDTSPIGNTDVESRLAVYPALPAGNKYELVLDKAQHSAFGDVAVARIGGKRNPNHHRAILAISTAFWDAFLKEDPVARKWIDSDLVREVLEPADRWQRK